MKHSTMALLASAAAFLSSAASAQDFYLPYGAPVQLVTRTELNTKDNRAGDRFYLEVAEPLRAHGQVVIPAGTLAVGEVVRSERNGLFGKSGKIETRILYIDTNDRHYALSGRTGARGKSGTIPTVAAIWAFGIVGGLVHGTSGYVRAGTPVTAYTGEDIVFAGREPAPSEVQRLGALRADPEGPGAAMSGAVALRQ